MDIITSLIALAVAYVGLHQYLLAKEKLRLDLFEKRLAVYKAVRKYLDESRKAEDVSDDMRHEFEEETHMAKFLFEADVAEFVDTLYSKGIHLNLSNRPREGLTETQLQKHKEIREEVITEFMEYNSSFHKKFMPYLKFRKWSYSFWIDWLIYPFAVCILIILAVYFHKEKEKVNNTVSITVTNIPSYIAITNSLVLPPVAITNSLVLPPVQGVIQTTNNTR